MVSGHRILIWGPTDLLAYFKFIYLYDAINNIDNDSFKEFINPHNNVSHILIAHFVAIQFMVGPLISRQWQGRPHAPPLRGQLYWISSIYSGVPPSMRKYISWPKAFGDDLLNYIAGSGLFIPTDFLSRIYQQTPLSNNVVPTAPQLPDISNHGAEEHTSPNLEMESVHGSGTPEL